MTRRLAVTALALGLGLLGTKAPAPAAEEHQFVAGPSSAGVRACGSAPTPAGSRSASPGRPPALRLEPRPGTEALGPLLRRVQTETGCSMVVIEHDMALLSSLCDELVALELGTFIARGTPEQVLCHPRVIASYLGADEALVEAIHR